MPRIPNFVPRRRRNQNLTFGQLLMADGISHFTAFVWVKHIRQQQARNMTFGLVPYLRTRPLPSIAVSIHQHGSFHCCNLTQSPSLKFSVSIAIRGSHYYCHLRPIQSTSSSTASLKSNLFWQSSASSLVSR